MLAPAAEPTRTLWQRRPFRLLTYSRFASRLAQNAVNFALVLLVVEETQKAFTSSLLVLVLVIPATFGGIIAGAVADAFPRRLVAILGNLLRAAVCIQFALGEPGVSGYFLVAALISLGAQFATAPEGGLTLTIVDRNELARVNALNQAVNGVAQLLGYGVLTPLALRLFDDPAILFWVCGALFVFAAVQVAMVVGQINEPGQQAATLGAGRWWNAGWKEMQRDSNVMQAAIELTLISTALIVLAGLLPRFIQSELGLPVDIGAVILLPAAVGVAIGLRIASYVIRVLPHRLVSTAGITSFAIVLALVTLTNPVADFLAGFGSFDWLDSAAVGSLERGGVLAAVLALPLGFTYATVVVAAQTLITRSVPLSLQGRVMATQGAMAALASSAPVIAAGALADVAGVQTVMLLVALGIGGLGFVRVRRHAPGTAAQAV